MKSQKTADFYDKINKKTTVNDDFKSKNTAFLSPDDR
jgi:hypothetical protein